MRVSGGETDTEAGGRGGGEVRVGSIGCFAGMTDFGECGECGKVGMARLGRVLGSSSAIM